MYYLNEVWTSFFTKETSLFSWKVPSVSNIVIITDYAKSSTLLKLTFFPGDSSVYLSDEIVRNKKGLENGF